MEDATTSTLRNFEWRLQRLDHYLTSASDEHRSPETVSVKDVAITSRLKRLEKSLCDIYDGSDNCARLAQTYADLPELADEMRPGTDTLAKKLPIVLSSASAYSDAVSKLTTLQQYPLSDLKELARLLGLRPRLAKFEAIQVQQAQQVEGLRRRSASIIYQWQKGHVLGSNQDWVSTEERLMAVEQAVKRKESARAREESDV